MPNSKHRKKQQAINRRQLERVRRKIQLQNARENDKENLEELISTPGTSNSSSVDVDQKSSESDPGWLGSLYSWCHSGIVQSVEVAKDVVFPTRALKRQLEDANERLRQMEDELRTMKENESDRKRQKIEDSSEVLPMPVSVPPPPPPPPPPVPPPPPPVSTLPKRQIMTRSKTAKLEKVGKELPAITLEDIKRVKLKSTANKDCTKRQVDAEGGGCGGGFVVSLADLKNVNLRKTKANGVAARRKSFHCSKDFSQSPPEFCRMKLKRLNHNRSPGGTAIKKRGLEEEFGEGPTPMLTRALRRKFQVACPISPLRSSSPSPVTSPANHVTAAPFPSSPLLTPPLGPLPLSPLS